MSNGSNYDVVVKLLTLGTGDLSASMNTAKGAMQSMASELGNADSGTKKLSATFRGVTEDGNKYTLSMRQLGDAHAKDTPLVDQLTGALGKLAGAYLSMESIKVFVGYLEEAVKVGIAHADQLNVLSIGIAGLGNSIVESFHASALTYGLDVTAMGKAFEFTQAKMSNANLSIKDQIDLITKLTLAGKSVGLDPQTIPQQIQMLLSGNVGARNKIAGVLGLTKADVEDLGTVLDKITPKMASITAAVELQNSTWTEGLKLVKENLESTLGDAFAPLGASLGSFSKDLLADRKSV